mgnify:CR=1 FL=1
MAIPLSPITQTTNKEFRVMCFQVNTPENATPNVNVYYGEVLYGISGKVLTKTPNVATLTLNAAQLITDLPTGNPHGLPSFVQLYSGLKSYLDQKFVDTFSGQFLS